MNSSRWFFVARSAWVIIAVIMIAAFIFTIPIRLSEPLSRDGVTEADFLAGIARIGISPALYTQYLRVTDVGVTSFYLALAIFIFWRKNGDRMGLLTSFVLMFFFTPFYFLTRFHPTWETIDDLSAVVSTVLFFFWLFVFPDGRFTPPRVRWVFLILLGTQVWRVFQPEAYDQQLAGLTPVYILGILISQVYRFRQAPAAQRSQIKWLVFGIVVGALPLLLFLLFYLPTVNPDSALDRVIAFYVWGGMFWSFFTIMVPISLAMGIFRSRLLDIDLVIRRTLQYSLLTGLLVLIFFGGVVILQRVFGSLAGEQSSPLVTVISTLGIAALFNPLRLRTQVWIDRRFYREKYNAEAALSEFSRSARNEVDLDQLIESLMIVVQTTVQPESASIWIKTSRRK